VTETDDIRRILREGEPVEVGVLPCPSGRLVVCDPFFCSSAAPLAEAVIPGAYAVRLYRVDVPGWGRRVAAGQLVLSPGAAVVAVSPASAPDGSRARYVVDSGLAAFMDDAIRPLFADTLAAFARRSADANYYWDVLEREFRVHATDPANPFDAGDYCLHAFAGSPEARVAMFSSGLGDGAYTSCWGLDAEGRRVSLFTAFEVHARAGHP
jgi:hypothetical protein